MHALHTNQIRQPLRPLQPRVHLVCLARLDGVLRLRLDVGPRLSYLLAYLRLRRVAIDGHRLWAVVARLADLKALRTLALYY
jgi:hypothetical protein